MSEPQLDREVRRRLAVLRLVEEVSGNVAMTCRYYGRLLASQRYERHDRRWKRYEKQRPGARSRSMASSSNPHPGRPCQTRQQAQVKPSGRRKKFY
ncbi:hypothetical protein [Saccharopolyspora shandongensis]|uniref:hypothetical protein n=1 Tax=Saccharopolyspora shandongensis TaxID=418495 RepID=UPI0033C04908